MHSLLYPIGFDPDGSPGSCRFHDGAEDPDAMEPVFTGRLKRFKIKVLVGDRVEVAVSPYDPTHGLITYRLK